MSRALGTSQPSAVLCGLLLLSKSINASSEPSQELKCSPGPWRTLKEQDPSLSPGFWQPKLTANLKCGFFFLSGVLSAGFCVSSAPGQHFCKDSLLPGVKQNFFAEHWQFETNQTRNNVSQVQCRDFYSHLTSYTGSPCSLTECLGRRGED